MHVYLSASNVVIFASRKNDELGTYLGTDGDWPEDKRRFPKWDGAQIIVDNVAKTASEQAEIAALKSRKKMELETVYKSKLSADYVYNGWTFDCSSSSRQNLRDCLNNANASGDGDTWFDAGGIERTLTNAQIKELVPGIYARGKALWRKWKTKNASLDALTMGSEIESFDMNSDWD